MTSTATRPVSCSWSGVLPAVTTQFREDLSLDLAATRASFAALVRDGVHGLVLLGTVGENNSLSAEEKRAVLRAAVEAVGGKVHSSPAFVSSRLQAPSPTRRMPSASE